jgi:TolA-binding protein
MAASRAQLAAADAFYARKDAAAAVPEYEKFLIMIPKDHPDRGKALYRLGDSQRMMGSSEAAEATLRSSLNSYPSGPLHPAASYHLGEILEAKGAYAEAASLFAVTAKDAANPPVKQAATFHQACCLEKSGKNDEANRLFLSLLGPSSTPATASPPAGVQTNAAPAPPENPYLIPALLHLASNATSAGKKEESLGYYQRIIDAKPGGEASAEASMKAALLLSDLGRTDESRKLLSSVASSKDAGSWKNTASLGLLRMAAASGDDDGVLKISGDPSLGEGSRAEILFLRAEALRRKGRHKEALEAYETLIREYPADAYAAKAPFQRLLSLHGIHSPELPAEIDRYLASAPERGDKARAQLLKAEVTLEAKDYAGAAVLYGQVDAGSLPASAKPDIVYKQAWSLLQAGDRKGGEKALSFFLKSFPSEERAAPALAQLATLKQEDRDFEGALADFDQLSTDYLKAPERELALQQKALLLGQLKRNQEMAESFAQLLKDYPASKAAPQAHYWTGWTAFEAKDYSKALSELKSAREGDPKQFGERAGLRILLCNYYQENAAEAGREATALKSAMIPPEVGRWLGQKSLEKGDRSAAERFLTPLAKEGMPGASDPEIQGMLASALVGQGKFREAQAPAAASLKLAMDPASRAKALLVSAEIQRALKNPQIAQSQVDEAMLLQPEGPVNSQARILAGDILSSKQDYNGAAKAYMTTALLDGDSGPLSLKALERAAEAYHRSGNLSEEQKARDELQSRREHASSPTTTPTP